MALEQNQGYILNNRLLEHIEKISKQENCVDCYMLVSEIFDSEMFYKEKLFVLESIYNIQEDSELLLTIADLQYKEGLTFIGALDFYNRYLEKTMPEFSKKFISALHKNYNFSLQNKYNLSKKTLLLCDRYRVLLLLVGLLVFKDFVEETNKAIKIIKRFKNKLNKYISKNPDEKNEIERYLIITNMLFAEKISDINNDEKLNQIALEFCPNYEIGYLNLIEGYLYRGKYLKAKNVFEKRYKKEFSVDYSPKSSSELYSYIEKRYFELGSYRNSILVQRNMLEKGFLKPIFSLNKEEIPPKISIVMPCYNGEKHLPLTFLSIVNQTFRDFEIIIVDDCSTDNSIRIIKDFCEKDSRFRLIELNKNSGAGHARNIGIKEARGEYIIFLDCDDVFSTRLLETAYNAAIKYDVDIVFFKAGIYNDFIKKCLKDQWSCLFEIDHYVNKIYTPEEVQDTVFQTGMGVPWNKLYRKSLIDEYALKFQEIPKHNDTAFVLSSYAVAKNWVILGDLLLIYRRYLENSITYNNEDSEELKSLILEEIKSFLVKNNLYEKYEKSYIRCSGIF